MIGSGIHKLLARKIWVAENFTNFHTVWQKNKPEATIDKVCKSLSTPFSMASFSTSLSSSEFILTGAESEGLWCWTCWWWEWIVRCSIFELFESEVRFPLEQIEFRVRFARLSSIYESLVTRFLYSLDFTMTVRELLLEDKELEESDRGEATEDEIEVKEGEDSRGCMQAEKYSKYSENSWNSWTHEL